MLSRRSLLGLASVAILSLGLLFPRVAFEQPRIYLNFGDTVWPIENTCLEDTCDADIVVDLDGYYPADTLAFQFRFDCKTVKGHVTTGVFLSDFWYDQEIMCEEAVWGGYARSCQLPYGWIGFKYCPDFMSTDEARFAHVIGTVRLYRDDMSLHNTVWFEASVDGKPLPTEVAYVGSPTPVEGVTWGRIKAMYK